MQRRIQKELTKQMRKKNQVELISVQEDQQQKTKEMMMRQRGKEKAKEEKMVN